MIEISNPSKSPDLAVLESFFISNYLPLFLGIHYLEEDNTVHVIISSNKFEKLPTNERILNIFSLIKTKLPDILGSTILIVEAYSLNELEDLLEYYV